MTPLPMFYNELKAAADDGQWDEVDRICTKDRLPYGGHRLSIYESFYSSYPYSKLSAETCAQPRAHLKRECGVDTGEAAGAPTAPVREEAGRPAPSSH